MALDDSDDKTDMIGIIDDGNSFGESSDSAIGSILADALASGEAVQIMRAPKKNTEDIGGGVSVNINNARMTIMSFFGQPQEEAEDVGITAEPASLQNMRRVARANRDRSDATSSTPTAATASGPRRKKGGLRRCHTVSEPESGRRTFLGGGPASATSFPNPTRRQPSAPRPLTRSFTSTTPPRSSPMNRHPAYTANSSLHAAHAAASTPDHGSSLNRSNRMGEHEETVQRLKVQDDDIQKILQDPRAFAKLQRVLRKHGAVTNEVLRQVLPLYVKHQINAEAAKEAEKRQSEEAFKVVERQEVVGTSRASTTGPAVATPSPETERTE